MRRAGAGEEEESGYQGRQDASMEIYYLGPFHMYSWSKFFTAKQTVFTLGTRKNRTNRDLNTLLSGKVQSDDISLTEVLQSCYSSLNGQR